MQTRITPLEVQLDKIARLLFPISIVLLVCWLMLGRSIEIDGWWHLANGRWMVENGRLLTTDPFSYTRPGAVWAHPGYPYELAMFTAYRVFGYPGVDLLASLVIAAGLLLAYFQLPGSALRRFLLVLAGMLVSLVYWSARPNGLTLLFCVAFIVLMERYRARKLRALWLLPVLMVLWVNLHGGFVVGFIVVAIYALDELSDNKRLGHIALVLAMMALATLLNPSGLGLHREMLLTASRTSEQMLIQEWQSPDFHQGYAQVFLAAILATLALVGLARQYGEEVAPLSPSRVLLPAALIGMALFSARNIAVFGAALPFIWSHLLPAAKASVTRRPAKPAVVGISFGFVIFSLLAVGSRAQIVRVQPVDLKGFPAGAVAYLKQIEIHKQLFNGYTWGGYLIWEMPRTPVFVDSRSDIYGDEIIHQSLQVEQAQPGWQAVIRQWDIGTLLVGADARVGGELMAQGWQRCYQDDLSAVYMELDVCPPTP